MSYISGSVYSCYKLSRYFLQSVLSIDPYERDFTLTICTLICLVYKTDILHILVIVLLLN